jgi:hypothetical protein
MAEAQADIRAFDMRVIIIKVKALPNNIKNTTSLNCNIFA